MPDMTVMHVQDAIDKAADDEIGKLFTALVANLINGDKDAAGKFSRGLSYVREAYGQATNDAKAKLT